jgi:Domain of unknown function (DUF1905)
VRLARFRSGAASPAHERISDDGHMEWTFTGEVIEWRGPAPYLFVAMTPEESDDLKGGRPRPHLLGPSTGPRHHRRHRVHHRAVPQDGRYLMPVKAAVQRAEAIAEGAIVQLVLRLNATR